jgi:hypothetical protein
MLAGWVVAWHVGALAALPVPDAVPAVVALPLLVPLPVAVVVPVVLDPVGLPVLEDVLVPGSLGQLLAADTMQAGGGGGVQVVELALAEGPTARSAWLSIVPGAWCVAGRHCLGAVVEDEVAGAA